MAMDPKNKTARKEAWSAPVLKKMDIEKTAQGFDGPDDGQTIGS